MRISVLRRSELLRARRRASPFFADPSSVRVELLCVSVLCRSELFRRRASLSHQCSEVSLHGLCCFVATTSDGDGLNSALLQCLPSLADLSTMRPILTLGSAQFCLAAMHALSARWTITLLLLAIKVGVGLCWLASLTCLRPIIALGSAQLCLAAIVIRRPLGVVHIQVLTIPFVFASWGSGTRIVVVWAPRECARVRLVVLRSPSIRLRSFSFDWRRSACSSRRC